MTVNVEKLKRMIELQDKMNSLVNPDWKNANYSWLRAAWIECAELMDYCCWKWWKKQSPDIGQAHIELVDIFHFLLSKAIEDNFSINHLINLLSDEEKAYVENEYEYDRKLSNLEWIEQLALSCLEPGCYEDYNTIFAILCDRLELSFDELYILYVGKNVLNIFRQDHGYKEGTYIKQWKSPINPDGVIEDNVYLEMFINDALKDEPEDIYTYLYERLEVEYNKNV